MIRVERILCPIDLAPESAAALRHAVALAQTYQAKLMACHFPGAVLPMEAPTILAKLGELIVPYLETSQNLPVEVRLVQGNDAAEAITQTAKEQQIDLIVMQSRRRPLAAALLGSVTEAVCRAVSCPVFVTHPQEQDKALPIEFRRILVAHDFSLSARAACVWGLALAQEYQAELHLLHVAAPDTYLDLEYDPGVGTIGKGVLADLEQEMVRDLPAEWGQKEALKTALRSGKPAAEILAYAAEQQVDLLCLGAHNDHKPRGLFGSNADVVLRQAPCPTLLVQ